MRDTPLEKNHANLRRVQSTRSRDAEHTRLQSSKTLSLLRTGANRRIWSLEVQRLDRRYDLARDVSQLQFFTHPERSNDPNVLARRSARVGAWSARLRGLSRTDVPVFRKGVRQARRVARRGRPRPDHDHAPASVPALPPLFTRPDPLRPP